MTSIIGQQNEELDLPRYDIIGKRVQEKHKNVFLPKKPPSSSVVVSNNDDNDEDNDNVRSQEGTLPRKNSFTKKMEIICLILLA
jgi:hypothetical protein